MSKGRKEGTGNVYVNGVVMTTKKYRNAVIEAIQHNGNNWMTTSQIVNWASDMKLCEKKDSPRQATTHPMWKIISMMMDEQNCVLLRKRHLGKYMYRLKNPKTIYIDGYRCNR